MRERGVERRRKKYEGEGEGEENVRKWGRERGRSG